MIVGGKNRKILILSKSTRRTQTKVPLASSSRILTFLESLSMQPKDLSFVRPFVCILCDACIVHCIQMSCHHWNHRLYSIYVETSCIKSNMEVDDGCILRLSFTTESLSLSPSCWISYMEVAKVVQHISCVSVDWLDSCIQEQWRIRSRA